MKVRQAVVLHPHLSQEIIRLGRLLVRLRHARKVKQADAALRAGVSRNTAYRIEKGDAGLAIGQLLRYLEAVAPGTTLAGLLAESDPSLITLQAREASKRVRDLNTSELEDLNF